MTRITDGPLLYVEWWDHSGNTTWSVADEIGLKPMLCRSVGWLFAEDKTALTLVPHHGESVDDVRSFSPLAQGTMTIYKPCIQKRQKLPDPSRSKR